MKDYLTLTKPRITVFSAATTAAGYSLAAGGPVDWGRFWWCLCGVTLAAAATGCLNQFLEREFDALMRRTRGRPLPAGRVSPRGALLFGLACAVAGIGMLAAFVGTTPCLLTLATMLSYLLVYTPLKRGTEWSTWIGAVPGAIPPVIGWSAAGGALGWEAAALFGVQFFWQVPHFLSLSWLYREDYLRAGFKVVAASDATGRTTARQLGVSCLALLAVSVGAGLSGAMDPASLRWTAPLGAAFLVLGATAARTMDRLSVRRVFLASLAYLPVFFLAAVLS